MANASVRNTQGGRHKHSARKYVIGYVASLALTAIAFTLALANGHMSGLMVILVVLAGLQIVVQLYFFMHVTESDGPPFHAAALGLGLFFTFAIALMSVWIMSFNSMVS